MKSFFTLKSAINKSAFLAAFAIICILPPHIFPEIAYIPIALAAEQTNGQTTDALVAKIKNPDQIDKKTQTDPTSSISYQTVVMSDPLNENLKSYLTARNSPLADYTTQLLALDNWPTIIAISNVESNMCIHHYYFNCSGIGGQRYLRKYHDYGEWINDMSILLHTRYEGWTLDKMDGVYVQPRSNNWKIGSEKVLGELTVLTQQAQEQRFALANSITNVAIAGTIDPQLVKLNK